MSCNSCNDNNLYQPCTQTPTDIGCVNIIDSQCITYTGDTLSCLNIETGSTRLEGIIQLIDNKLCTVASNIDFSDYNTQCLRTPDDELISTQQEFVESISLAFCNLLTNYENFTETTHADEIQNLEDQIYALNNPGLTCSVASVTPTDTIPDILTKYCSTLSTLNSKIDLTGVNWSQCFATSTPTTVAQGFNAVINMICSTQSDVDDITPDDHLVLVSSTDTTPGYLVDKLTSDCITITEYTDGGEKKLNFSMTKNDYTFDTNQFDVVDLSSDACGTTKLISLKSTAIPELPTIDCNFIDALHNPIAEGTRPSFLRGGGANLCQKYEACGILRFLFEDFGSGTYNVVVNTAASDPCDKITLVAAGNPLTCSNINTLFTAVVTGEAPSVIYGNDGTNCQKYDACGIRNWIFDGYTTGNYVIAIDTTETGCDKITLVEASGTGVTPALPCWTDSWEDFSADIDTSVNDTNANTWTIGSYGVGVFSGAPAEHNPAYKFDVYGNMLLRGTLQLSATPAGSDGECRTATFDVPLTTLTDSCFQDITKGQVIQANVHITTECSTFVKSFLKPYVVLDIPGNTMYLRVEYSTLDTGAFSAVISLDGIQFNLG